MKLNNGHVLAGRVTRLAKDLENQFFKIEQANRWPAAVFNGTIAGAAVALIAWVMTSVQEGDLILFACLGSSAASVVFAPLAKANSLRSIVTAYVIAAGVCLLLNPFEEYKWLPVPVLCFVAVGLPIAIMRLLDCMHPAAIGSALAFIIYERPPKTLVLLLLAILGLLTIVKVLAYIYLEELTFKQFKYEFRRNYYGRELLVTMTVEDNTPKSLREQRAQEEEDAAAQVQPTAEATNEPE